MVLLAAVVLGCPTKVWADGGVRATPDNWPWAWNGDVFVLFNLVVLGSIYGRGLIRLWRRAGAGRGVSRLHAGAWLLSVIILLLVLVSPLDALSEELSSAHMVQHMALMLLAAPLFVLGSPALVIAWGLPRDWRGCIERTPLAADWLWRPAVVWALYAVTLWAWHLPLLYHAALRDPLVHDAQHFSFFAAACFFWRLVLDPLSRRRLHPVAATLYLFTTSLHASVLGVFMALSPRAWYADYAETTAAFGLSPLEDQQLAGLIMWVPACLVYPIVAAAVFGAWLAGEGAKPKTATMRHSWAMQGGPSA